MLMGPPASGTTPSRATQSAESVPAQPGQDVIVIPPSSPGVLSGSTQGVIRFQHRV